MSLVPHNPEHAPDPDWEDLTDEPFIVFQDGETVVFPSSDGTSPLYRDPGAYVKFHVERGDYVRYATEEDRNKSVRITNISQYEEIFGKPPKMPTMDDYRQAFIDMMDDTRRRKR